MKAQDLRIGNLVYGFKNKVIDITGTYGKELVYSHAIAYDMNQIKPIPLTEEWIRENIQPIRVSGWIHIADNVSICFTRRELCFHSTGKGMTNIYLDIPEYVHLLQNVVFALTREELKNVER